MLQTLRTIMQIPVTIKNIWKIVYDLESTQTNANKVINRSHQTLLDTLSRYIKNQSDVNDLHSKKLHAIEADTVKIKNQWSLQENINDTLLATVVSDSQLQNLLTDTFNNIDVNLSDYELQCNGQEEMQNFATSLDDLSLQIQESNSKINETYLTVVVLIEMIKDLQKRLKPKNVEEKITNVV